MGWAGTAIGSPVVEQRPLVGGITSTMLGLVHADGTRTVLRLIDREPWLTHRVGLATREADVQRVLAGTDVPAPRSLALDAEAGAHLMTWLSGTAEDRADDHALERLARLLASIHAVVPADDDRPRPYQSWAWEEKFVVPDWAEHPAAWQAAFELLRTEPPSYDPVFLHRDYGPHNVLWQHEEITGVVDWVETSTGPAWLDVAHGATNLALRHGTERGHAFAAAYADLTGERGDPYWDVMDVVGFLPPPGRAPFFTDPAQLHRLEQHLLAVQRSR